MAVPAESTILALRHNTDDRPLACWWMLWGCVGGFPLDECPRELYRCITKASWQGNWQIVSSWEATLVLGDMEFRWLRKSIIYARTALPPPQYSPARAAPSSHLHYTWRCKLRSMLKCWINFNTWCSATPKAKITQDKHTVHTERQELYNITTRDSYLN
jgi:hypothetical protein